jgi:hypothetical protein
MIEEIRASVNDSVTEILQDREFNNAAYYERRRREWQRQMNIEAFTATFLVLSSRDDSVCKV